MKNFMIFLLTLSIICPLFAQDQSAPTEVTASYYGFSGLMFIPNTQTYHRGDWNFSYSSRPGLGEDLSILPFSFSIAVNPFNDRIELAFTNTYYYASNKKFGGVPYKGELDSVNILIPIIPSVKYRFMDMSPSNFSVSMAFGVAAPYGAYYVVDKFFDLMLLDFSLHTGIATKLTTYHAFAGATVAFGKRTMEYQRSFPVRLSVEGSWGGSLDQLDEKEEAFIAFSMRYQWTASLSILTFYRIDQQPSVRRGVVIEKKPTHKMGMGLSLTI